MPWCMVTWHVSTMNKGELDYEIIVCLKGEVGVVGGGACVI